MDTFMFEGHDSTTAATNFATYLLGAHPWAQARAREELNAIFGSSPRCPTVEDLKKLPYLEKVIKETLRLFPSVPFIPRKVREDFWIGPHIIPKDTCVMVFIYAIHRNEQVFPDPDTLAAERFDSHGESGLPVIFDCVPFSAGQRNYIGKTGAPTGSYLVECGDI